MSLRVVVAADIDYRERRHGEAERLVAELSRQAALLDREARQTLQRLQGDLYLRKGQYAKAAASYAEIAPEGMAHEASVHRNYGIALRFSEACPTALQQFQLAIRQSEKDRAANSRILQDALSGAGDCHLLSRKYGEAVTAYRQAVEAAQRERRRLVLVDEVERGLGQGRGVGHGSSSPSSSGSKSADRSTLSWA